MADVVLSEDDLGVVKLGHTKTGRRHAAFEASTTLDPACGRLYRAFRQQLPARTHEDNYVFLPKAAQFYKLFSEGFQWLGLGEIGFKPYSLRRGGATAFFRCCRNMEATLDRGRWSTPRVARIYLNDGLAREVELRFTPAQLDRLRLMASAFALWLPA